MKLLGNQNKGLLFIVSSPSGAGKTTLIERLENSFDCIKRTVTYTTRAPREGELHGKDYYFISKEEFKRKIKEGFFLEYAEVYGNYYGTSKQQIFDLQDQGNHVVLVIDTQGALNLKNKISAVYIFIAPPSLKDLKERIGMRNTDSKESVQTRLAWAEKEMQAAIYYDYKIINDKIDVAYEVLKSIFIAEEHRI